MRTVETYGNRPAPDQLNLTRPLIIADKLKDLFRAPLIRARNLPCCNRLRRRASRIAWAFRPETNQPLRSSNNKPLACNMLQPPFRKWAVTFWVLPPENLHPGRQIADIADFSS